MCLKVIIFLVDIFSLLKSTDSLLNYQFIYLLYSLRTRTVLTLIYVFLWSVPLGTAKVLSLSPHVTEHFFFLTSGPAPSRIANSVLTELVVLDTVPLSEESAVSKIFITVVYCLHAPISSTSKLQFFWWHFFISLMILLW